MQIVTYRVAFINSNGSITYGSDIEFIDSVPVKKVQAEVAAQYQRAPSNVIVSEVGRRVVA